MNVLIVGRTKMGGSARCVGGIAHDGKSVRLLTNIGANWDTTAPFQVGDIWDITYIPTAAPTPPHTEDVVVSHYTYVGPEPNLRAHLLTRLIPWQGSIDQVFGGVLGYTASSNGYICHRLGVPGYSTWFWTPDRDLTLRADGRHIDYVDGCQSRGMSYVGEPNALPIVPAGTLTRVSLARWWKPADAEPEFEERCYLQLSGWYL
jgi:ATP-dependent DNA helicase RecQ